MMTAEELLQITNPNGRQELISGKLFEFPFADAVRGCVAMRIGTELATWVHSNRVGKVFAARTGFILGRNPDTVRAPDASFVTGDRLPEGELPVGYIELAPDLAVEVVSPSDSTMEIQEKVADWLRAGTRLVCVIYPATRSATVRRSQDQFEELAEYAALQGENVIPRSACGLSELFS